MIYKPNCTKLHKKISRVLQRWKQERFSVWQGTIEGIKTAPFFGAGTGGEQKLINEGYAKTGYQEGIDNSYNAHNQYLQFMARNGILELGCFLTLLIYSFKQSLKIPNYTFLMFNMSVTLIMFTESFLDVQRGIVFFYFFLCAFIYLPYESTSQPLKDVWFSSLMSIFGQISVLWPFFWQPV